MRPVQSESRPIKFPLHEKAHLPLDVVVAAKFVSGNGPRRQKDSRRKRIGHCQQETGNWRSSLTDAQRRVRGNLNLPLLARKLSELRMGGQEWLRQHASDSPIFGSPEDPGVYPAKACPDVELASNNCTETQNGESWLGEQLSQTPMRGDLWEDGPFPFDGFGPAAGEPTFLMWGPTGWETKSSW